MTTRCHLSRKDEGKRVSLDEITESHRKLNILPEQCEEIE